MISYKMHLTEECWIRQSDLGKGIKRMFMINDNELVAVTKTKLHTFCSIKNKWRELNEYPDPIELEDDNDAIRNAIAFNNEKQLIYIVLHNGDLLKIDLMNKKSQIIKTNLLDKYRVGYTIFIGNDLHIISESKHLKWNQEKQIFEKINNIICYDAISYIETSMIYIPSNETIISFAGYEYSGIGAGDRMYSYSLKMNNWTKIDTLPNDIEYGFGYIIISIIKKQYIILFGGVNSNVIYLFDVETKIFKKCLLKCPSSKGPMNAVLINNYSLSNIILYGYIRRIRRSYNLPNDLLDLMCKMYCIQYVHLIDNNGSHWKLLLNDIINY